MVRNILLLISSILLVVVNVKNRFISKNVSKSFLIVKYGNLGDIYIMLSQMKKFDLDNMDGGVTIGVPQAYYQLVQEYFPNNKIISLPNMRSPRLINFFELIIELMKLKFGTLIVLGGSSSPIEEDLCATITVANHKIRSKPDTSKGNALTRLVGYLFYDETTVYDSFLEEEIIKRQLEKFFDAKVDDNSGAEFIEDAQNTCKTIVVFPGASSMKRRWNVATLKSIIVEIKKIDALSTILVIGTRVDGLTYIEAKKGSALSNDAIFQFGKLSIDDLEKAISGADLVISNDSAPMHIAKLFSKPLIVYSGQGHLKRFVDETRFNFTKIGCANCNWDCKFPMQNDRFLCVEQLNTREMLYEFRELLSRTYRVV